MKKIALVGSGGLGREVLGIIQTINREEKVWDFIGFYDDNLSDKLINNYSIRAKIETLNSIKEELAVVIAIGNPKIKELIYNKINNSNISFPAIIHPSVINYDEETTNIGEGVVIGANTVLTVNIEIGKQVYINTASIISHDVSIGNFSMIMPTVAISAGASIEERVYLGNDVKIDQPIIVKADSIIKAGTILPG